MTMTLTDMSAAIRSKRKMLGGRHRGFVQAPEQFTLPICKACGEPAIIGDDANVAFYIWRAVDQALRAKHG
jgi:hypothetical protein